LAWKNQRSNTTSFKNKQLLSMAQKFNSIESRRIQVAKENLSIDRKKDLVVNFISSSKYISTKASYLILSLQESFMFLLDN
jgi:uncharacterized membrane protein